jgi:hypothetical protein
MLYLAKASAVFNEKGRIAADRTRALPGRKGSVYCDMQEFLAFHKLPDKQEIRRAVWEELERRFEAKVTELLDD